MLNEPFYEWIQSPPDDLSAQTLGALLNTRWAGRTIEHHQQIDSTNRRARELALGEGVHGALVLAEQQMQGQGRRARKWQTGVGEAVLMSLLLRPEALHPADAPGLVILAALAVCDACRALGAKAQIKWPNDIVLDGKKLCGMLLQSGFTGGSTYVVVGIGINVGGAPEGVHATSLNESLGRPVRRAPLIAEVLRRFEDFYDQWRAQGVSALLPAYRAHSATLGRRVRVECATGEVMIGMALDVTEDGALLFERENGERIALHEGDVSVRGMMGYV